MYSNTTIEKIKNKIRFSELFQELYPHHYRTGNGNSLCPFHKDENVSFALHDRYGKCHAGDCLQPPGGAQGWDIFSLWQEKHKCGFKEAADALAKKAGVKLKVKLGEPTACYDYRDAQGKLLFQTVKYEADASGGQLLDAQGKPTKTFRQRRPTDNGKNPWADDIKGVPLVLYGLPELLAAHLDVPILICEGEKDVETARALGFVATCNPMGAGKFGNQCRDHRIHEPLRGRDCWIIPDCDKAGRDHAQDVARALHGFARSVKILELPNLPEKGDLSDYATMMESEELAHELLTDLAAKTPEYDGPKWSGPPVISLADLALAEIPEPKWIIHGLLPQGLCLLAGEPKYGKSWLVYHLVMAVASGGLALGRFRCEQRRCLYLALEDNLGRLKGRMVKMLGTEPPPRLADVTPKWKRFSGKDDADDGLRQIQDYLGYYQESVGLVVIDTLERVRPAAGNRQPYSYDYNALSGLQELAGAYGVAVVAVTHTNQGQDHKDPLHAIQGTNGLTGAADTCWVLTKPSRLANDGTLFQDGRDIERSSFAMSFDGTSGLWSWTGTAADVGLSPERRAVRHELRRSPKGRGLQDLAIALDKPYENVKSLVSKMHHDEQVARVGDGIYALPPEDDHFSESWSHNIGLSDESVPSDFN